MSPLALLALLGLTLLVPLFTSDSEDDEAPIDPIDPEEPVDPSDPMDPLEPATATLDAASNTVTVTTDPDETGTLYTVASRVDAVNGDGETTFVYEAAVVLAPEGVDLVAEINAAIEGGGSTFYYDPAGSEPEFLQLYTTNFGDGGQIDTVVDVSDQAGLTEGPSDFEGELAVFETTTDYFFDGQLVRTEVLMQFAALTPDTDFAAAALALAEGEVTQTPTPEGAVYAIGDGSLTAAEFLNDVPGADPLEFSYGVSTIEYDTDGSILSERITGGVGITANVDIQRYTVLAEGTALPTNAPDNRWAPSADAAVITAFADAQNIPAGDPEAPTS